MEDEASPYTPPHGDDPDSRSTSHCMIPSLLPEASSTEEAITVSPHAVVRLIQCSRCSLPLQAPLRLPCGEERKQGFTCYWVGSECGADHCLGDCGTDVLLTRLVEVFDEVLGSGSGTTKEENAGQTVMWTGALEGEGELEQSAEIGPDPLRGVFDLVKEGRFSYDASEVRYQPYLSACHARYIRALDELRDGVRNELDCQVCYSLILDPLTTPCGHTFCRGCVAMALSHSNLCPICRRKLNMPSSVRSERINKKLSDIIQTLLPDEVTLRRTDIASDIGVSGEGKLPLAVVSLAFPTMPIGLHIFEPRYRLMIQRVMESRSRKFGMVMPNHGGRFQEGLGRAPFMQYGTILAINRHELLPDGRSLLIATGTSRFKVLSWELVDGYHVGKILRVDDVSISEEEAQESRETAAIERGSSTSDRSLDSMSTQQLYQLALDFVLRERRLGAPWLHPRVLLAYGALPTDPALFPWWFATVLPRWEEEKYTLLATTTVRQRLKITARWVKRLESRQCVVTTFGPFPMSVSITFWPGGTVSHFGSPDLVATDSSDTYMSQALVLGFFLVIFMAQMTINVVQAVRSRQPARVESTQTRREQPDLPAEIQDEDEDEGEQGQNRAARPPAILTGQFFPLGQALGGGGRFAFQGSRLRQPRGRWRALIQDVTQIIEILRDGVGSNASASLGHPIQPPDMWSQARLHE
ncbi:PUA-like domain-containing protein [Aspergillus recurvatus]